MDGTEQSWRLGVWVTGRRSSCSKVWSSRPYDAGAALLDHLVGGRQQRFRDGEAGATCAGSCYFKLKTLDLDFAESGSAQPSGGPGIARTETPARFPGDGGQLR
jgi:hypothetical protein